MWLAILYVCVSAAKVECDFIVSPVLDTRMQCIKLLAEMEPMLNVDDKVVAYDRKCIQIQIA